MILAIGLLGIGAHRCRHSLGRHQLVSKARQHAPLDIVAANGTTIIADPFAVMTETAITVIRDNAILSATASANQQT
jgi:hypothetical protein